MNNLPLLFDPYITEFFQNRPKVTEIWQYINNNFGFTIQIGKDIDKSIILFNKYKNGKKLKNEKLLKSSLFLKKVIKNDLPSIDALITQILNDNNKEALIDNILKEINNFTFIETMSPIESSAGTLLLGSYRSAILINYPYLKINNVQIASSLEEMIALIYLNGERTKLFDCVKSWYINYEEEGFTKELSEAVFKK